MNAAEILRIRTAITDATTAAAAEAGAWQAVLARARQLGLRAQSLEASVTTLEAKIGPIVDFDPAMFEGAAAALVKVDSEKLLGAIQSHAERMVKAAESMIRLTDELQQDGAAGAALAAAETAVDTAVTAIDEAADSVRDSFETLADTLTEDVDDVLTETAAELEEQLAELRSTLEDELQAKMEETFEEALDDLAETTEETVDACAEKVEQLAEDLGEAMNALEEQIDRAVEKWSSSTKAVVESYEALGTSLEELGRDVDMLRDATTAAMQASGVGMTAASRTLEDMMGLMGSVS